MISTQIQEHICRLALFSTGVKGEKPISVMIFAPVESGKSEILKKFAFVPTVKIMTDFNTFQFADFVTEYQAGIKKSIIIPDFLRITHKKHSTAANSLGIIQAITEEGWIGKLPLGQPTTQPIHANVLTALTSDELADKRHKWSKLGFLSRFLPVSYKYSEETINRIRGYIRDRIYTTEKPYDFELPKESATITMPHDIASAIDIMSQEINSQLKNNPTGFRLQRQLQTLAMSSALACGRNMVDKSDIEVLERIQPFINFKFKEV